MKRLSPLLLGFFAALAFQLPCAAGTPAQPAAQAHAHVIHAQAATLVSSSQDENLPETGSALPLLSTIGAGVLLGGLVSAKRTRPGK
jgi:LPXTG-motif cell wall-anchored protein